MASTGAMPAGPTAGWKAACGGAFPRSNATALRPTLSAVALALVMTSAAADDYLGAPVRVISAPDCVDATNFVREFEPAPFNVTYMRVQHIGDVGSAELAGEVAYPVTWNVGQFTGLVPAPGTEAQTQRGYRDAGPPSPASAFQLACRGAGFYIDSRSFYHRLPLVLEGPSASIARDLSPPAIVFRSATSALTIEATIRVPFVHFDRPAFVDGTAQVSFMYYAEDTTTGTFFGHTIQLYDNRPAGTNGAGTEAVSADAYNAFVISPLAQLTAEGVPTQFVEPAPGSSTLQFVASWSEPRLFRVHIPYARFETMLARLIRDALPSISPHPEDYRINLFGVLGEIFPGTGTDHEVALGASVTNLTLAETWRPIDPVAVVEFHHAGLDHYFISSRAEDIEALDSGRHPGWRRTGESFPAWPAFVEGSSRVCRFYLPPAAGDSHFFSASEDECRQVAVRFPSFVLEDPAIAFMALPDAATGACPRDTLPVFRLWNARTSTNHRYTTDPATRSAMLAAGWRSEGYGPMGVAMCSPDAAGQQASGRSANHLSGSQQRHRTR